MTNLNIHASFKILFEKHYSELCSLAYNYLKDKEKSKDIVQDIYTKVWENKKNLITEKKAHHYLFTSVKNNCIDVLRKNNYTLYLSNEIIANKIADTDEEVDNNITVHDFIQKALLELPPKCRLIFMMSKFDKMTYKQIASKLNLSVKTIENQMSKAIRIMRNYIKKNKFQKTLILFFIPFLKNNRGF